MQLHILETAEELGRAAAAAAAAHLRQAIQTRGEARCVLATGNSQLTFLAHLVREPGIAWSRVSIFHLDEYIGLSPDHPASFRHYLEQHLVCDVHPGTCNWIDGLADPRAECRRVGALLTAAPVDLACVGIGENGHLAFNDPPADFETEEPFIVVTLDEPCRRQQVNEGWFARLADVPATAISMSIRQILKARTVLCIVPEQRKAKAVRDCLEEAISPLYPASSLCRHRDVAIYLDRASASLLASSPDSYTGTKVRPARRRD
jgi:glucosamine-6-phosphate deaminase